MTETKKPKVEKKKTEFVGAVKSGECKDRDCITHGRLKARGKIFEGIVKRKFPRRVMIELERMIYVKKYERYAKSRTRIHARLSDCMDKEINLGDLIRVQECRPLSKIIHFVVIKKIKSKEEVGK
ncbi:30S ribosomal protein S17 [Candidatus Pacearchaeota archaeon]|nr:30S ribosomal protein S17 [Candidatus Pacearchaeota archaeon]